MSDYYNARHNKTVSDANELENRKLPECAKAQAIYEKVIDTICVDRPYLDCLKSKRIVRVTGTRGNSILLTCVPEFRGFVCRQLDLINETLNKKWPEYKYEVE